MNRRGINDIVSIFLIIALVICAIFIMWRFVSPYLRTQDTPTNEKLTIGLDDKYLILGSSTSREYCGNNLSSFKYYAVVKSPSYYERVCRLFLEPFVKENEILILPSYKSFREGTSVICEYLINTDINKTTIVNPSEYGTIALLPGDYRELIKNIPAFNESKVYVRDTTINLGYENITKKRDRIYNDNYYYSVTLEFEKEECFY